MQPRYFFPTLVLSTRKCTVTFSRLHQKGTGYPGLTLHHFSSESWHRLTKGTRRTGKTEQLQERKVWLSQRIARTGVWHTDFWAVLVSRMMEFEHFVNCCVEWAALPAAFCMNSRSPRRQYWSPARIWRSSSTQFKLMHLVCVTRLLLLWLRLVYCSYTRCVWCNLANENQGYC